MSYSIILTEITFYLESSVLLTLQFLIQLVLITKLSFFLSDISANSDISISCQLANPLCKLMLHEIF